MSQLIEQAMLNKLDDALNDAITTVGGDASKASSLMDYPDIVSKQLTVDPRGIDGRLIGDETISVKDTPIGYALSAVGTADAKLVRDIKLSDTKQINKGETVQDVFTYLFASVLPNMSKEVSNSKDEISKEFGNIRESLKEMDIDINVIISSHDGKDNYSVNDILKTRCDLNPLTYYLRIRKTNSEEAVYISLQDLIQLNGDVLLSDEAGLVHYSILGHEMTMKVDHPNTYYLAIGIGKFTHPSLLIDLKKINLSPSAGSITPDKLDKPTQQAVENVPVIHEEVKKQTDELEKQKETIVVVEKKLEETLSESEAKTLVDKIFK